MNQISIELFNRDFKYKYIQLQRDIIENQTELALIYPKKYKSILLKALHNLAIFFLLEYRDIIYINQGRQLVQEFLIQGIVKYSFMLLDFFHPRLWYSFYMSSTDISEFWDNEQQFCIRLFYKFPDNYDFNLGIIFDKLVLLYSKQDSTKDNNLEFLTLHYNYLALKVWRGLVKQVALSYKYNLFISLQMHFTIIHNLTCSQVIQYKIFPEYLLENALEVIILWQNFIQQDATYCNLHSKLVKSLNRIISNWNFLYYRQSNLAFRFLNEPVKLYQTLIKQGLEQYKLFLIQALYITANYKLIDFHYTAALSFKFYPVHQNLYSYINQEDIQYINGHLKSCINVFFINFPRSLFNQGQYYINTKFISQIHTIIVKWRDLTTNNSIKNITNLANLFGSIIEKLYSYKEMSISEFQAIEQWHKLFEQNETSYNFKLILDTVTEYLSKNSQYMLHFRNSLEYTDKAEKLWQCLINIVITKHSFQYIDNLWIVLQNIPLTSYDTITTLPSYAAQLWQYLYLVTISNLLEGFQNIL